MVATGPVPEYNGPIRKVVGVDTEAACLFFQLPLGSEILDRIGRVLVATGCGPWYNRTIRKVVGVDVEAARLTTGNHCGPLWFAVRQGALPWRFFRAIMVEYG